MNWTKPSEELAVSVAQDGDIMARKKIDKLSMCAAKAKEVGVSYGKYMAMKEPEIEAPAKTGVRRICKHCGKEFFVNHKKRKDYCSDRCRENFYYHAHKEYEPIVKTCPICGKEFVSKTYRNKYCSEFCAKVAHGEWVKKHKERKASEAEDVK